MTNVLMSSANRSFAVGSYDAQKGEDVVTFREQFQAARLIPVRRALMWSPLLLVLAGCGATAHRAASTLPPVDSSKCRAGVVRAGSANVTVAAAVRSTARAYRRPRAKPFARFGRVNVNVGPPVFRVLRTIRCADCAPRG